MTSFQRSGFLFNVILQLFIAINIVSECRADIKPGMSDIMLKMKTIKDRILNGYDKHIRPTKDGSNTTMVDTFMIPRQIIEVDEEKGLFMLDSYFIVSWEDPRLKWNTTADGYSGLMRLPIDIFWLPDITVHNSHSVFVNPTQLVPLMVYSTGKVTWVPPLFTKTYCPALMAKIYPGDEVECRVTISSWVHDGWGLNYNHGEKLYMHDFVNINPRWELVVSEVRINRSVEFYEDYDEPYIFLNFYFPMRRRPIPELEGTRNPCILIMILTLSIFWLPPNSEKKILILGFMFLVLNVLLVYVAWSTTYPLGVLLAVTFLQSTMTIVVATFLLQVIVIFNLCKISSPLRPPQAAMWLLTGPVGKYAGLHWSTSIQIDRIQLKEDADVTHTSLPNDDWTLFASGFDKLLFVLITISMITVHHL